MLKAVFRVSAVEGVIAQIASSEVRIRFLGAPILSKQLQTAGGQKISESRGAGGYFRRVVLPCRILVASDVRRLDVGMRERTIVSHTPLGFWNYHFWLALLVSTVRLSARAAGCESFGCSS